MTCEQLDTLMGIGAFLKAFGTIYITIYFLLIGLFVNFCYGDLDKLISIKIKQIDRDQHSDKDIAVKLINNALAATVILTLSKVIKDFTHDIKCNQHNPRDILLGFLIGIMAFTVLFYLRMFINWLTKPKTKNAR